MFKAELIDAKDLTPCESAVLCRLCEGLPDKSIARLLNVSIKTVYAHEAHIYQKLNIKKQAVNIRVTAINNGMVEVFKG